MMTNLNLQPRRGFRTCLAKARALASSGQTEPVDLPGLAPGVSGGTIWCSRRYAPGNTDGRGASQPGSNYDVAEMRLQVATRTMLDLPSTSVNKIEPLVKRFGFLAHTEMTAKEAEQMNRVALLSLGWSRQALICLALAVALVPAGRAQDVTFSKTKYSSVKQPKEAEVDLSITDSKILVKGKKVNGIDFQIPYSSIDAMSYELASRHRVAEGAVVMLASLGAGAVLMATKSKSHWLDIQYHEGDAKELMVLRLDKSEYKKVIATLEARTGKSITVLDSKKSPLNPTAESKNIDQVISFRADKIAIALKAAMESQGCNVTEAKDDRIECKRARGGSERTGFGGEKVTATLEAKGDQTRVRIETGKGFRGRLAKKNWSTAIYDEMMKSLQRPPNA